MWAVLRTAVRRQKPLDFQNSSQGSGGVSTRIGELSCSSPSVKQLRGWLRRRRRLTAVPPPEQAPLRPVQDAEPPSTTRTTYNMHGVCITFTKPGVMLLLEGRWSPEDMEEEDHVRWPSRCLPWSLLCRALDALANIATTVTTASLPSPRLSRVAWLRLRSPLAQH